MEQTLAIYLAGFIDGEGCFLATVNKATGGWQITLAIGQSNIEFLQSLQKEIGFGSIHGKHPHYRLHLYSEQLRNLLPIILPHLRIKKREAEITLEILEVIKHRSRRYRDVATENKIILLADKLKMEKPCNKFQELI
jgi:hypothetical protein